MQTRPRLSESQINTLHQLFVKRGLADSLDALLAGIDKELIASLPWEARPDARLLRVLHELNDLDEAHGRSRPLGTVVENATLLLRRRGDIDFLRALLGSPDAPPAPVDNPHHNVPANAKFAKARRLVLRGVALTLLGGATIAAVLTELASEGPSPPVSAPIVSPPPYTIVQVLADPPVSQTLNTPPVASSITTVSRARADVTGRLPDSVDTVALERALISASRSAQAQCAKPDSPKGSALVSVTFGTDGHASRARVTNPPFAGTNEGRCVEAWFMRATIPPYSGPTLHQSRQVTLVP